MRGDAATDGGTRGAPYRCSAMDGWSFAEPVGGTVDAFDVLS